MTKIMEKLYSPAETAVWLHLKLGPIRDWGTTLADMRRGKTSIKGANLLPFSTYRPDGNKRPLYRICDIQEFIRCINALGIALPSAIRGILFEFDEPTGRLPNDWKHRTLIPRRLVMAVTPTSAVAIKTRKAIPGFMYRRTLNGNVIHA